MAADILRLQDAQRSMRSMKYNITSVGYEHDTDDEDQIEQPNADQNIDQVRELIDLEFPFNSDVTNDILANGTATGNVLTNESSTVPSINTGDDNTGDNDSTGDSTSTQNPQHNPRHYHNNNHRHSHN